MPSVVLEKNRCSLRGPSACAKLESGIGVSENQWRNLVLRLVDENTFLVRRVKHGLRLKDLCKVPNWVRVEGDLTVVAMATNVVEEGLFGHH